MDDSRTPTDNLQIESQDGCHPGDGRGSIVTRLPSASDENENQLDGDGQERLSSAASAMGRPDVLAQDSLNNNDNCPASNEVAAFESSENAPGESPRDGQALVGKDNKAPGKRSPRTKRGPMKKIPQARHTSCKRSCSFHSAGTSFVASPRDGSKSVVLKVTWCWPLESAMAHGH